MARASASDRGLARRGVLKALRAVPQLTRMSRHAWSLIRHSTPRKVFNLIRVEAEYRLHRTRVGGHPYILIVDPMNVCNLRCPLCPTGLGKPGRKGAMMPWETFTRTIDQLAPWAYEVNLHNWGESILHPHICDMIAYARGKNLATNLSVNLNDAGDDIIDGLIESGLEYLILSIDGATQDSYARYRVRGNLDRVLANARKLLRRRKELGSATPYVEWQFIVFRHNVHEIEAARALACEIGVDRFRIIPPGLPFDSPEPDALKKEWFVGGEGEERVLDFRTSINSPCFYLYRSFTVNPDGATAPCCVVNGKDNDFGQILEEGFEAIWNNEKYHSARSLFRKDGQPTTRTVCDRCDWFDKKIHSSSTEGDLHILE